MLLLIARVVRQLILKCFPYLGTYMLKRISSIIVLGIVASGCSVTADGIGPAHHAPDAVKVAQVREQLQENVAGPTAKSPAYSDSKGADAEPGILVIGTAGPLRTIEDKDRGSFYSAYLKAAAQWHPGAPPSMDATTFQEKLGGWASVQTFGIPGIGSVRHRVLVPTTVVHEARFASAAGSFLFGTTGDLVIAKTDHDGLLWVERVLCRDDRSYHSCAGDYKSGVFDRNTGQELGRDRKPKANGSSVDVATYVKIARP
jgi:hypothetical protein